MSGWLGSMIDNIAQDVRQDKAMRWDWFQDIRHRKWGKRDRDLTFAREDSRIQRLVADAQAAGVHPLFALGAQLGGVSSGMIMPGGSSAGQSGSAGGGGGPPDRMDIETHQAALEESRARTELLKAQTMDFVAQSQAASQNSRAVQGANSQQDLVKLTPDVQVRARSSMQGQTAGSHPAYRQYVVTDSGLVMDLPYSEEGPSEALENVPLYLWPLIIQHNRAKYGDDWGTRFYQEFVLDRPPIFKPEASRPRPRRFSKWGALRP